MLAGMYELVKTSSAMKRAAYFAIVATLVVGAFLAGSRYHQSSADQHNAKTGRRVLYYIDPMHPAYKSDKPGIAPDCGMELVPVYADEAQPGSAGASQLPRMTGVSSSNQQAIGIKVSEVRREAGACKRRLFGRVVPDERRIYKLNAGIDGFIQDVSAVSTGTLVKKDELLATFSAPNVTMTVQTFILNLGAEERFQKSADSGSPEGQALPAANANVQQRIQQLLAVGMSPRQIDEIRHTKQVPEKIKILSPIDGFVLARNVSPGQKFDKGADFFMVGDLSRVWILADVADRDLPCIRVGMPVQIAVPEQDKHVPARIAAILPQIDPVTRTVKVRMEADNPAYVLRPEMFVDVEVWIKLPPQITVPADAVIDSGLKKTVFVEKGSGVFEPREVQTGAGFDGQVQIVRGLRDGERIVTSGAFMVDSETRLHNAATTVVLAQIGKAVDPSCGMQVDVATAHASSRESEYGGKKYYFCSDECKRKFDTAPARFVQKTSPSRYGA